MKTEKPNIQTPKREHDMRRKIERRTIMPLNKVVTGISFKALRYCLCLLGLLISGLLWSTPIDALCIATAMEGNWENVELEGVMKRIELRFKCCDQIMCPSGGPCVTVCNPDEDSLHVYGLCDNGPCDWGRVVPDYSFVDALSGYQCTRVDAHFQVGNETRRLVVLLLGNDRLLVHSSIDYPEGGSQKDFSLIEYFERQRCFTLMGRTVCIGPLQRKFELFESIPKVIKK